MLLAFILTVSVANFTEAQVALVPGPAKTETCFKQEGKALIPVPCGTKVAPAPKPSPVISETGDSQTFNDVLKPLNNWLRSIAQTINATANQITLIMVGALSTFFDNAKDFFRKIKF